MNMIAFLPLLCCEPKRARSDGWFHRFHGYVIVAVLQNVSPALSPPSTDRRRCAGASKTAGIRDGLESHALTRRPNERGPHASSPCVHVVDMRARAPDDLLLLPPKKATPTRRVAREQSVVWYAYQALAISKHVVSVKPLCVHERINREYASRPIVAGQVLPAGPARDSRLRCRRRWSAGGGGRSAGGSGRTRRETGRRTRRRVLYDGYAVRGWLMLNLPVPCTGFRWKRLLPSWSRTTPGGSTYNSP
jgi:hypothetical protein